MSGDSARLREMSGEQAVIELQRLGYDRDQARRAVTVANDPAPDYRYDIGEHRVRRGPGGYSIEQIVPGSRAGDPPWLAGEHNVAGILHAVEVVDAHLDEAAPEIYRMDHPASRLANRWRRIAAGPASEGQEAVDALNLATGGNPRKGVIGDEDTILGELGDGAVANLLAIQSITKDTGATWRVFLTALAKAWSRVPEEDRLPGLPSAEVYGGMLTFPEEDR